MSDIAISVQNISKRYRIGVREQASETFRGALASIVTRPVKNLRRLRSLSRFSDDGHEAPDVIWALKDVSFDVGRGEVLGIIGPNGAGKSTLLKVLTRITEATSGRVVTRGRVASLLEVGTGFHPELTGRDNVFMNGAVLGMSRAEIRRKFDEIVDFSGVEKFIDTPVKRYSSGMKVRLAFAVAAHLEPDILLVDEVLAVGDIRFQKKSLGKLEEVAVNQGRTVVFVSHNVLSITRLCHRAIFLDEGMVAKIGDTNDVVAAYVQSSDTGSSGSTAERRWDNLVANGHTGSPLVRLLGARVHDSQGQTGQSYDIRKPIGVEVEFEVLSPNPDAHPEVALFNAHGVVLFVSLDQFSDVGESGYERPGTYKSTCWIPGNFMAEGTFYATISIVGVTATADKYISEPQAISFEVTDTLEGGSVRGHFGKTYGGVVRPMLDWRVELDAAPEKSLVPQ